MADPVAFEFETAKQLLRLLKKSKDGVFNSEVDDSIPLDHAPAFIWAYVPTTVTCTYDATVKAWIIGGAVTCYPINSGVDAAGLMQWGKNNSDGIVTGGITCTTFTPKLTSTQAAPSIGKGFYLGTIFGYDGAENPRVLIGLPPESSSSGSATIELVSDVICTPTGIEVQTVQLSGKDYDTAIIRQFLGLSDVIPVSYSGQQNRVVKVNSSATGLEFGLSAGTLEADISTIKADIVTLKANVVTINTRFTGVDAAVASVVSLSNSLATRVTTLEGKVTTLQANAADFESRLAALENP
jgi:hypothetical protein